MNKQSPFIWHLKKNKKNKVKFLNFEIILEQEKVEFEYFNNEGFGKFILKLILRLIFKIKRKRSQFDFIKIYWTKRWQKLYFK